LDIVGKNNNKKPQPAPIGESGKELSYRNSTIHRVKAGFIVQGGDFIFGNGSGGESIFNGKKFKDERAGLALKHDRAGILSMGNSGKNANTSQFFVTLDKASQCDGKHVVFGEVVSGMEVLRAVEKFASEGGEPTVPIQITDCGAYTPLLTAGGGFCYDRPDSESFSGITTEFLVRPRVGIIAPNKQVANRFQTALGEHASTLLVSVDDVDGGNKEVIRLVIEPLENFALDIVVAAPACAKILQSMDIPDTWKGAAKKRDGAITLPEKDQVFLEAKPANVMGTIISQSWVGSSRSDWLLSASFAYCNWQDLGKAITLLNI
jgi:cyclophilin family peptidyl-prolyl cis-trans isomerase